MEVEAVTEVLDALSAKLVREHAQIVQAGQTANTLYLVVSGHAHLEGKSEGYDLEPGDVFGQESLQVAAVFESTVTARSELRLLLLSGDDLRRLARKYPLLGRRLENKVAW
jgi:CRP-like cAMP-binding protein